MRLVRVMCTGRIDPAFVLRAFSDGADGVYIGGCWPGECHYTTEGNYHALSMMLLMRKLLKHVGVNPERLRLEWVGASEGIRFAEIMNEVAKSVKELGPLGKSEGIDETTLKSRLEGLRKLLPYIKLVERERLRVPIDTVEEYNRFFDSDEVDRLVRELIVDKLAMSELLALLREKPLSTREISKALSLTPTEVSKHLKNSAKQGLVRYDESKKRFALA